MSNSCKRLFFHIIWTTKKRIPFFSNNLKIRVYRYIEILATDKKVQLLAIGGTHDHVHMLIRMNQEILISNLMREVKSKTTLFINRINKGEAYFAWQNGYGVFTVSPSAIKRVISYIKDQEEHHKDPLFEEKEIKILLNC